MITNKDVRVENGNLVLNGDKYPLDGQSPEAIMQIVEDNSDTTPTENSTAPITSGGVFTANKAISEQITGIENEIAFQLFDSEDFSSWDDFPNNASGYGFSGQTNSPGFNGFVLCWGSSSIRIQVAFSYNQTGQKYRVYVVGAWGDWLSF